MALNSFLAVWCGGAASAREEKVAWRPPFLGEEQYLLFLIKMYHRGLQFEIEVFGKLLQRRKI
jgi:hypothetical protein